MVNKIAKRSRVDESREELLEDLRDHILCREHTNASLARVLEISPATVSRALKELRRRLHSQGKRLVVVKEGRTWHYEIPLPPDRFTMDPFWRSSGLVPGVPRSVPKPVRVAPPGPGWKDALYPPPPGLFE